MALDKDLLWSQLDRLWHDPTLSSLPTRDSRYVLFSDIHLGDGKGADDFIRNKKALLTALDYYSKNGFTVVLLGDVEELWQFDLKDIVQIYKEDIYQTLQSFGENRLLRVFGNHDREWGGFIDPIRSITSPQTFAPEAVKLKDADGQDRFLLVHGHQGSLDADKFSWFSRFWTRMYGEIEPLLRKSGIVHNPSATKSQVAKDYERTLYAWAKLNKVILICGHSHRAIFASQSYGEKIQGKINELHVQMQSRNVRLAQRGRYLNEIDQLQRKLEDEREKGRLIEPVDKDQPLPCYFNIGCGLYTDGLTAIEIDDDDIRLVKWNKYQYNTIPREVFNEGKISQFVSELA